MGVTTKTSPTRRETENPNRPAQGVEKAAVLWNRMNLSRFAVLLAVPVVALATACGGAPDRPGGWTADPGDPSADPGANEDPAPDPRGQPTSTDECNEGQERECKVLLPTQGAIQNCFVGVSRCESGTWGPCGNP
jgi:hypothetical protein